MSDWLGLIGILVWLVRVNIRAIQSKWEGVMVASAPVPPDKLMKCNPASSFNSSSGDTATAGSLLQALPLHPPAARAAP